MMISKTVVMDAGHQIMVRCVRPYRVILMSVTCRPDTVVISQKLYLFGCRGGHRPHDDMCEAAWSYVQYCSPRSIQRSHAKHPTQTGKVVFTGSTGRGVEVMCNPTCHCPSYLGLHAVIKFMIVQPAVTQCSRHAHQCHNVAVC